MLSIYRGNDRGKLKDDWSAEVRSGIAALYLSRLNETEMRQLEAVFQAPSQYHGIRNCRYWRGHTLLDDGMATRARGNYLSIEQQRPDPDSHGLDPKWPGKCY